MLQPEGRGILTDSDRRFLEANKQEWVEENSKSARSQKETAIADRVYNALLDLTILYSELSQKQRNEVFGALQWGSYTHNRQNVVKNAMSFLLLGLMEQENPDLMDEEYYEEFFEALIAAVQWQGGSPSEEVEVDISVEETDLSLSDGPLWDLPTESLRVLLFEGEITDEEFAEAILAEDGTSDPHRLDDFEE